MFTIRASSLGGLFDCPARWEAKHIKGLKMPASGNSALGRAVHAGTAAYDMGILNNMPISIDDAAGAVVDAIYKSEEEVDWGEDSPREAENIALALHKLYCLGIAPKQKYVGIEVTCESLEITDLNLTLTGTTDRIVEYPSGYGIADIKTGKNAVGADGSVKVQGHAAQMAVYELLAEHSTGLMINNPARIMGLQVAKTDKGRRAGVGTITGGRDLLLGSEDSPGLLQHTAEILKRGMFPGNPRSMMCGSKYCPIFNSCKWRR